MSEIFVSPGVYVRERDFSFYVSSVGQSSLALIGETEKGPAFRPTMITNMSEFRDRFGDLDPNKLVGYCARSYFKNANSAWIVRVLGNETLRGDVAEIFAITTTGNTVVATLMATGGTFSVGTADADENIPYTANSAASYSATGYVNLVNAASPYYIGKVFPRTNDISDGSFATQHVFPKAAAGGVAIDTGAITAFDYGASPFDISGYKHAQTPVIVADSLPGIAPTQLFVIHTQTDGQAANKEIKIAIENIDSTNDSFDVVVRDYADTNAIPVILERFPKLSMDKTNLNYIARAIGDTVDDSVAEYELISKYIYVEVIGNTNNGLAGLIPYGFNPIYDPMTGGTISFPGFAMTTGYSSTISTGKQWLGVDYANTDPDLLMYGHSSAWDMNKVGSSSYLIKGFHLNSGASAASYEVGYTGSSGYTKFTGKFIVPVLGGNDGWNNYEVTRDLLDPNELDDNLETQWKEAIDTVASTEGYDINIIAVPGVAINNAVGDYAIDFAETRADCIYVGDMPNNISTATAAAAIGDSLNSNYACTYWPYVKIYDQDNRQDVIIPPTPQVLEALAYTDSVSYPWFAPAGLNRGILTDVVRAQYKLTQLDRETLYDAKVNPIATLGGQGIAIWGQKTLQTRTTALDRINVRRMLLYVEKVIAGASKYLVFEQNDEETWDRFKGLVQPVLDAVRIKRGIVDFRVIMDETTNTPDIIDRNQMVGQIYIKPTKTAEAILINFNILPQGAVFEE